ncbi:MAG: S41 family peptidase [Armatimonadetes bacterium]|nr:S41 family peptidase [Armatimonadota bacterium]
MKTLRALLWTFAFAILFTAGFVHKDFRSGRPVSLSQILLLAKQEDSSATADRVFKENYNRIEANYYKPVNTRDLQYAGYQGMFASLGDPHTNFLPPPIAREFDVQTHASFVGIGARVESNSLGGRFVTIFPNSPAQEAGIIPGDVITAVDGVATAGKTVDEVVDRIRGKEGTKVKVRILRDNKKVINLTLKRREIIAPTVTDAYLDGPQVAYVQIATFSAPTASQFDKALDRVMAKPVRGLVIDLRGDPGGYLETAIDLISRFVEDKLVLRMKSFGGKEEIATGYSGSLRNIKVPIVLLVDSETASAAEIFAGNLKDYHIATLVGEHTYGKNEVQDVFPLKDGSTAKITIAKYLLPSTPDIGRKVDEDGRFISGGIEPDFKVNVDPDLVVEFGNPSKDPVLQRALDVIKSKTN